MISSAFTPRLLIVYTFTFAVFAAGTAMPETLHRAPIAIVDEDGSALSARIFSAFYPPEFIAPARIGNAEVDAGLDAGIYTLVLVIPPDFQRDVLAGRAPALQLNVDATRMSQAFVGAAYVQQIVGGEIAEFVQGHRDAPVAPVELATRVRFNPTLSPTWFGALMELVNVITMVSIILTGAALIREREHGTIEHLLAMPVTPAEIMLAKVWAMGLVVMLRSPSAAWCACCWRCRWRARHGCSLPAWRCTCSPPPRWAFSWRRWRAACRSSAC